jgi:hypothetical protein
VPPERPAASITWPAGITPHAANGWLKTQSWGQLTVKTRLPGMGRTLVNVLTPLLWLGLFFLVWSL